MPRPPSPSSDGPKITRRALLGSAAGGAALLAARGLPAWARPVAFGASGAAVRGPESLPFPHKPAGTPSMPVIEHIVVLMMENHSFDNLLGMVPWRVPGRAHVDGLRVRRGRVLDSNPGPGGKRVHATAASSPCQLVGEPMQTWNASHQAWNFGHNNGFVAASGPVSMRFWDERDLPFTYSLAHSFPIGERYFSSVLAQTFPNRRYFFTGTSSGLTATDLQQSLQIPAANGTIWDRLDAHHVDWGVYYQNQASWLIVPGVYSLPGRPARQRPMAKFFAAARDGSGVRDVLPQLRQPRVGDTVAWRPPVAAG
jgi:phospholipase C